MIPSGGPRLLLPELWLAVLVFWLASSGIQAAEAPLRVQIDGSMPRLNAIPPGCAFHPRCGSALPHCSRERPELMEAGPTRAACWLHAQQEAST